MELKEIGQDIEVVLSGVDEELLEETFDKYLAELEAKYGDDPDKLALMVDSLEQLAVEIEVTKLRNALLRHDTIALLMQTIQKRKKEKEIIDAALQMMDSCPGQKDIKRLLGGHTIRCGLEDDPAIIAARELRAWLRLELANSINKGVI